MAVITISRQVGSAGHEISRLVCEQLGYQLLDKELMAKLGAEAGLSSGQVVDLTSEEYYVRGWLERLFSEAAEVRSSDLVGKIILAAYRLGNVVVVGRGGQVVLRDKPGVLHVRVVAPLEHRIAYLVNRDGITADAARGEIKRRDGAAADYVRRYYQAEVADPLLYQLVINTGKVTPDAAADLIVKALAAMLVSPTVDAGKAAA